MTSALLLPLVARAGIPDVSPSVIGKSEFAKKPEWSGSVGLGFSSSTGTSQSLNLNTDDKLLWHRGPWANQSRLLYNYATSQGEVSADRLDVNNQTRYDFALNQYIFGNLNYHRNHFDGYYFRAEETLGYGHFFVLNRVSNLRLEAGAGVRQSHLIGGDFSTHPIAQLYGKYLWQFSPHAHLSEAVDAILADNGANTYNSILALTSPLYGPLNLRLAFIATYNTKVQPGYKPLNTLTTINLAYEF
ncbi:DUF481 domain-containing protein [Acidithiobacillus marinus]|uniref:DUF481 domain-containing protein n=1 Tax=Acidithiobacillus marinus TaxID=187490 RepID=UPI00209C39F6|nr:DUF481 domain-containing protein [Acidithiobacillus marinus]